MKVRLLSDLHFEKHQDGGKEFIASLNPLGVDLLVLAGDIAHGSDLGFVFEQFRARFSCPIAFVHGNHEFYYSDRATVLEQTSAYATRYGIIWLDCATAKVHGRRILGAPLWFGRSRPPQLAIAPPPHLGSIEEFWQLRGKALVFGKDRKLMLHSIQDFEAIENFNTWIYEEHDRSVKFLRREIREDDIVITHYLPSRKSVVEQFKNDMFNPFFVVDLTKLIEERKPALWIHGHTHSSLDYSIGKTHVVCNPFGYVGSTLNPHFEQDMTVDV